MSGHVQKSGFVRLENGFVVVILGVMTLLPLVEFSGRPVGLGITGSASLVQHLTIWVALFGAALAARSASLLALATAEVLPEDWRPHIHVLTSAVAIGITAWLCLASAFLVQTFLEFDDRIAFGIPVWVALLALPAGFLMITLRLILKASDRWTRRLAAAAGLAIPIAFTWGFAPGQTGLVVPAIAIIVLATVFGMPIFAALGGISLVLFWNDATGGVSLSDSISSVPLDAYELASDAYLPAIPLFTAGGYILARGGAGRRLMDAFTALLGWMPGGLAIVVTLILAFFTPLTGASGVTILSLGGLLLPMMLEAGYPERTSTGLVTVSGSIGLLFFPSLPVILYGVYAGVNIRHLFVGALVPGVILVLAVAAWAGLRGYGTGAVRTPFVAANVVRTVWAAGWELLLPIVLLGGYLGGYFASLVEAAAVTLVYALLVECFVYRDLSWWKDMPGIGVECATLVGSFFIILEMAYAFNNFLVTMQVPDQAAAWVRTNIDSPLVFLLALNVLLIIVGALMDIYSAIFVVVPLVVPMAMLYPGIDPVHLGVIFLANMELGYLMPPMGENLFLAAMRFEQPLSRIYSSTLPYVVILAVTVLVITYVPALTLWPVAWFGG